MFAGNEQNQRNLGQKKACEKPFEPTSGSRHPTKSDTSNGIRASRRDFLFDGRFAHMYYAHIARPTNVSHQHPKKLALRIFIALGPGFSAIGANENQQRFSARQILEYIAKTLRSVVDTGKPSKVRLDRAVRVYRPYAAYPNISTKIRGGPNEQDREQRGPQ